MMKEWRRKCKEKHIENEIKRWKTDEIDRQIYKALKGRLREKKKIKSNAKQINIFKYRRSRQRKKKIIKQGWRYTQEVKWRI